MFGAMRDLVRPGEQGESEAECLRPIGEHPAVAPERTALEKLQGELADVECQIEDDRTRGDDPFAGTDGPDLETLFDRRRSLQNGVRVQKRALSAAEKRASREVCEKRLPQYREIQHRMADAAVTLGSAVDEEAAFRGALKDAGYRVDALEPNPLREALLSVPSVLRSWMERAEERHGVTPRRRAG